MERWEFSQKVIERLGYYVYLYINPLDNSVFYVGKGIGNRAFAHLSELSESRKVATIREILAQGKIPTIEILVHGLQDEQTALRIEAAVIDLLGKSALTNQVRGWESTIVGRMEVNQLAALYDAESVQVDDPVLLIRINQLYRYGMSLQELYEATRGIWKIGVRRNRAQFALAVYRGLVREVYRIQRWHPAGTMAYRTRSIAIENLQGRWEFEGNIAEESIRDKYLEKYVGAYFAANSQNPIRYVNC